VGWTLRSKPKGTNVIDADRYNRVVVQRNKQIAMKEKG